MSESIIENQSDDLETKLQETFFELGINEEEQKKLLSALEPLKSKDPITNFHYKHCIRVGLKAKEVARFMHLDEKALFYAGLLHDVGKCHVDLTTLGKTEGWTDQDAQEVQKHVLAGHEMLKGKLDFSAEIIARHHKFQENGYPETLPEPLHNYSEGTRALIDEYARILALADVYDALHRVNDKFGEKRELNDQEIKQLMLELNPDKKKLLGILYNAGVFSLGPEGESE